MLDKDYFNKKFINVKKELTKVDLKIIERLEVEIQDGLYTISEYDNLKESLGIYYNIYSDNEKLKYKKSSNYNISKEEYDQLLNQFYKIDLKYEKLLEKNSRQITFKSICFKENQHIRDKFIKALKNNKIDKSKKEELLKIVMNLNTSTKRKERFIMYYGLDKNKKEIHSISEISKLQGCSYSGVRQSIIAIQSKLITSSDIDKLREILDKK